MTKVQLNIRENEIVRLICQQLSSHEIAEKLKLTYGTIENYRRIIQKKIGAKSAVGIAIYAYKHGLVSFV